MTWFEYPKVEFQASKVMQITVWYPGNSFMSETACFVWLGCERTKEGAWIFNRWRNRLRDELRQVPSSDYNLKVRHFFLKFKYCLPACGPLEPWQQVWEQECSFMQRRRATDLCPLPHHRVQTTPPALVSVKTLKASLIQSAADTALIRQQGVRRNVTAFFRGSKPE